MTASPIRIRPLRRSNLTLTQKSVPHACIETLSLGYALRGQGQNARLQQPALAGNARAALVGRIFDALDLVLERSVPYSSDVLNLADELVRFALRLEAPASRRRWLQTLLAGAISRVFQLSMLETDFIILPSLPRPTWMPGRGGLAVREMLGVLRRPAG